MDGWDEKGLDKNTGSDGLGGRSPGSRRLENADGGGEKRSQSCQAEKEENNKTTLPDTRRSRHRRSQTYLILRRASVSNWNGFQNLSGPVNPGGGGFGAPRRRK